MKPFNLEEYKLHPDIPLITRDGHKARIICTDFSTCYDRCIIACIQTGDGEVISTYYTDGHACKDLDDHDDLFFAVEPMTKYVNVFYNPIADLVFSDNCVFDTYEEAYDNAKGCRYYSSTNKITYYK